MSTTGCTPVRTNRTLAAELNATCQCIRVDRTKLREQLVRRLGHAGEQLDARAGLVSGSVVFLEPEQAVAMDRSIALIGRALQSDAFEQRVREHAPAIATCPAAAAGGVLGFDFHLGSATPQLIEINTNPGGLLVNLELARAITACCDCLPGPVARMAAAGIGFELLEHRIADGFLTEWTRARGAAPLRTVAIVDDDPAAQYLHPEFLLYRELFERAGWNASIVGADELRTSGDALWAGDTHIDLVYNRVTDFYFAAPRHAALRDAYERNLAVVTPHPAAHARRADKRLLAWLGDEALLARAGLDARERADVLAAVPRTEIVDPDRAADLWSRRRDLFFKPVDGFGGKAAYRGDKLTRGTFEHILANRYVAQAIAPASVRRLGATDEAAELRLDVRTFSLDGVTLLRSARLYRGQTTNFRTPGGGFAPVLELPR